MYFQNYQKRRKFLTEDTIVCNLSRASTHVATRIPLPHNSFTFSQSMPFASKQNRLENNYSPVKFFHSHSCWHSFRQLISSSSRISELDMTLLKRSFHSAQRFTGRRRILTDILTGNHSKTRTYLKLALIGIIPNQILFSFSSDKDRRTDSRIRRKNTAQPRRESNPGSCELSFPLWLCSSMV